MNAFPAGILGEWRYDSSLSQSCHQIEMSGQRCPTAGLDVWRKEKSSISNQTICTLSSPQHGDYCVSYLCSCKYKLHLLFLFHLIILCTELQDVPLTTENNSWQINLLPLTAFVRSYGTSLTWNMHVASQRITIVTFVLNLHISHKSHCIFYYEVTLFTSRNKDERRTALNKSHPTCRTENS